MQQDQNAEMRLTSLDVMMAGQSKSTLRRDLFGGAISCNIPERFVDVSDFRPVPDHQEVHADGNTDQSFVVEIVEATATDNHACGSFYFNDMAHVNDSQASKIDMTEVLGPASFLDAVSATPGFFASLTMGTQLVSKGYQQSEARNPLLIALAVLRLPQVASDLLISINAPLSISSESSSAEHASVGFQPDVQQVKPLLLAMLATLQIHDWGLFGASEQLKEMA